MITDAEVEIFINGLSKQVRLLLNRISEKELWPVDHADDIRPLIDELSDLLKKSQKEVLNRADYLLLANSAHFSLERFVKFISDLSKIDPSLISNLVDKDTSERLVNGEIFLKTVLDRFIFLVRSMLIEQIFNAQALEEVLLAVGEVRTTSVITSDEIGHHTEPKETSNNGQLVTQEINVNIDDSKTIGFDTKHPPLSEKTLTKTANESIKAKLSSKNDNEYHEDIKKNPEIQNTLNKEKSEKQIAEAIESLFGDMKLENKRNDEGE